MNKILITGGCSFSECMYNATWPRHLEDALSVYRLASTAVGSQGNGLISRKIIYQVSKLLASRRAEDLLVGIMWSGPDRHDYYIHDTNTAPIVLKEDSAMKNPIRFIHKTEGSWTMISPGWRMPASVNYYANFHDSIGHYIYTLEHILRTQWFLKSMGVKYFMTTYTGEVLPDIVKTQTDTKHLYELVDTGAFLPVIGEYEWCRDYSGLEFPIPNDKHPSVEQHQAFTQQIILPFLKEKNLI
jgi:hypothetical protein